jgi:ABC-type lipoprotein export system ATPase subunit
MINPKVALAHRDILFFEKPDEKEFGTFNYVKNFLVFLKSTGNRGNLKFSSANDTNSLHEHLNIKQNIMLDSLPQSFSGIKEEDFEEQIKKLDNKYLLKLIKRVFPLDRTPAQLNEEERKVAILVKALLVPADFIFLDSPDFHLNDGNLNIFKQSLIFESYYSNKTILLTSSNPECWKNMATKVVHKEGPSKFNVENNSQSDPNVVEFIKDYNQKNPYQWEIVGPDKKVS